MISASFLLPALIFFFTILPFFLVKLLIYFLSVKFKLKIKFQLKKFHQLTNIEIVKYNKHQTNHEPNKSDAKNNKQIEIKIDKLWLSSCYLNRQINDRITICINNLTLTYFSHENNKLNNLQQKEPSNFFLLYLAYLYFKHIGTFSIENLHVDLFNKLKHKINLNLTKLSINLNKNKNSQQNNDSYFTWSPATNDNNLYDTLLTKNIDIDSSIDSLNRSNKNFENLFFIKLQSNYVNLKLFNLASSHDNSLIFDLLVNKLVLNLFIKNDEKNRRLKSDFHNFSSLHDLIKKLSAVQFLIQNSNLLLINRWLALKNEPSYFKNYQFLIDYLESLDDETNKNVTTLKNSKSNYLKCFCRKIHFVFVHKIQAKFLLDNSHHQNQKYEIIECEQVKVCKESERFLLVLKQVEYLKTSWSRNGLNLLDKLIFEHQQVNNDFNIFSLELSCLNLFLYLSFLRSLFDTKFVSNFLKRKINEHGKKDNFSAGIKRYFSFAKKLNFLNNNEQKFQQQKEENIIFILNVKNSFVHLIDNLTSSGQLSGRRASCVYSIGASNVCLNYSPPRLTFSLKHAVLFKSTMAHTSLTSPTTTNTTTNATSTTTTHKYQNNLFDVNNYLNMLRIFDEIRLNSADKHYWGNLLSFNELEFNYDLTKYFITTDTIKFEYSPDFLKILNFLIDNSSQVFSLIKPNQKPATASKLLKLKIKKLNVFLIYKHKFLLDFQVNEISFTKLYNEASLTPEYMTQMMSFSCVHYRVDEINQLTNEAPKSASSSPTSLPSNSSASSTITLNHCLFDFYNEENVLSNYNLILLVKQFNFNYFNDHKTANYSVSFSEVLCTWSLQIHVIFNDALLKPLNELSAKFKKKFKTNLDEDVKFDQEKKLSVLVESDILVNFLFDFSQDSTKLMNFALYSPIHTVSIILSDFYFLLNSMDYCLSLSEISAFINADDQNIYSAESSLDSREKEPNDEETNETRTFFRARSLKICKRMSDGTLEMERKTLNTTDKQNKLTSVNFDLFSINFIYNYDFAKLIDHVLNVRKCLKLMNASQEKTASDELSTDLLINIRKFQLVIEDDPFEVKLAYNYALMCDEHSESVKRRQALEQRRLIKEQHLEKEALEILSERESIIYLQRSRMIYNRSKQSSPAQQSFYHYQQQQQQQQPQLRIIRTELFSFTIDNLEMYALCDSEWHGREKCFEWLRKIDPWSPAPMPPTSTGANSATNNPAHYYQILWCRYVNFNCDEFKFTFRDYTQPLLKLSKAHFFGHLAGAEYQPAARAIRDVKIDLGPDFDSECFNVKRNMVPFKIYHDLCAKMNFFSLAYGPCWEGCMAQFNLSLDKIIHPSRDPSRPMPWWDKSRLYLHGRLTLQIQHAQIIYHVSMDPYNRTEEMKWLWTNLFFDWTNRQMQFIGSLDIYLNTESKYDDCRVLHLPNLELKINIEWLCKNSSNLNMDAHNLVIQCAPDKIPTIINSTEHDSYAQFRSENVNISFSFICSADSAPNNYPTCKFYASTSRFIERIKNLLSAITRPTRRGKIFNNLKPRKPILSRHFKTVRVHVDVPKLNIVYWSSASQEYGVQFECEHFKLNSAHKLDLVPFVDSLKRRAKPFWSIEIMKISLAQTTIYLIAPLNNTNINNNNNNKTVNSNFNQNASNAIKQNEMKSFFLQVDSIFYEREKNSAVLNLKNEINESNNNNNNNNKINLDLYESSAVKENNRLSSLLSNSFLLKGDQSGINQSMTSLIPFQVTNMPKHNVRVNNLKAKWNNTNRDVIFILYEIYNKAKRLRHNLSSQALKQYDMLTDQLIQKYANEQSQYYLGLSSRKSSVSSSSGLNRTVSLKSPPQLRSGYSGENDVFFEELFNKLVDERGANSEIYCDDKMNNDALNCNEMLYGVHAATKMSDIINENIFIEFINSQIKLSLEDSGLNLNKINNPNDMFYSTTATNNNINTNNNNSNNANKSSNNKKQKNQTSFERQPTQFQSDHTWSSSPSDYLIISAAKANVVQRVHKPVMKSQRLLDKTSWSGYLETMQYFATINLASHKGDADPGDLNTPTPPQPDNNEQEARKKLDPTSHDEYWLSDDIIDPSINNNNNNKKLDLNLKSKQTESNKNHLGMLITHDKSNAKQKLPNEELTSDSKDKPSTQQRFNIRHGLILNRNNNNRKKSELINEQSFDHLKPTTKNKHLQLIVSKCRCEFYMVDFDDKIPDEHETTTKLFPLLSNSFNLANNSTNTQIDLNATFNEPIDCFSLIHYDLNLCTNSEQYRLIMDIVSQLVLYFRPRRKQVIDKQKSIKFNLQLSMGDLESLKAYIQLRQVEAKELLCKIRAMERRLYHLREKIDSELVEFNLKYGGGQIFNSEIYCIQELRLENNSMEKEYKEYKRLLNELSDELNISIGCYKELMLEKRAFNLANTPQFVQHVLNNRNSLNNQNNSGQGLTSKYIGQCSDLSLSSSYSYISKLINDGLERQFKEPRKLDLDQQAQMSILNNEIGKRYEVLFKHTQWTLNDFNGQTECAKFLMKNFLYTKVTNQQELDCVEHTLEVESCKVEDLSESSVAGGGISEKKGKSDKSESKKCNNYVLRSLFEKDSSILEDSNDDDDDSSDNNCETHDEKPNFRNLCHEAGEINNSREKIASSSSNSKMIRVYCKERPPVGIPVIEHLEVNVSPLSIKLTNAFYKMMMKFFFENQNQVGNVNGSGAVASNQRVNDPKKNVTRHAYHKSATEEQLNGILQLNLPNNNNNNNNLASPLSIDSSTNASSQSLQSPTNLKHILQKISSQTSLLNNNPPQTTTTTGNVPICNESKVASGPGVSAVATAAVVTSNTTAAVLLQLTSSQSNLQQTPNNNNNPTTTTTTTTNNTNNNTNSASTGNSSQQLQNDDVEIMKQRSANNNTFLCIKIPEIQMLVSFKANNKDKNLKDLNEVSLLFPLFEVHDQTWTWLDLIDAIKSHVKKALVSQALKHKLIKVPIQPVNKLINRTRRSHSQQLLTNLQIDEHEQMTIVKLFGTKFIEKKSQSNQQQSHSQLNSQLQTAQAEYSSLDEIRLKMEPDIDPNLDKPLSSSAKQNSSVSLSLKRRFFKFGKEKEVKDLSENEKNKSNNKRQSAPK